MGMFDLHGTDFVGKLQLSVPDGHGLQSPLIHGRLRQDLG